MFFLNIKNLLKKINLNNKEIIPYYSFRQMKYSIISMDIASWELQGSTQNNKLIFIRKGFFFNIEEYFVKLYVYKNNKIKNIYCSGGFYK